MLCVFLRWPLSPMEEAAADYGNKARCVVARDIGGQRITGRSTLFPQQSHRVVYAFPLASIRVIR